MAASKNLTPEQRSQRARMAAQARWATEDPRPTAQRAHAGLRAKFAREVAERFPGLDETELARRGESAFKAHMTRMAFESSKARSRKASGRITSTKDGADNAA